LRAVGAGYALRTAHLSALAARRYFLSGESNQSPLEGTHRAVLASVRRSNASGGEGGQKPKIPFAENGSICGVWGESLQDQPLLLRLGEKNASRHIKRYCGSFRCRTLAFVYVLALAHVSRFV
jgi:hypothetical protein